MGVVEATYAEIKQQELKKNPYSCLSTAAIDVNPHQVEAFTFSLAAMKLGGAVLADEVGLGKTIEAGLVLKYLLNSGSQKILLVMPSNLRKQWQVELDEKFEVESFIVESGKWDEYKSYVKNESAVVIVSYNFASRRKSEFAKVPWSFCVFDEAHRLRNVYKNGSKMASNLYELTKGIPKLMLTATPMQNSLFDLYGLIQFIDKRIFYSKAVFSDRYIKNEQYEDLRHQVSTVLQRTLRKEVSDYIQFPERKEMTVFKGVFGASDRAIGLLESGADFEKRVSHIYQECKTSKDFTKEFTSLERELDRKRNKKMEQLKSLIIREAPEQHKETFEKILSDIQAYQEQLERV